MRLLLIIMLLAACDPTSSGHGHSKATIQNPSCMFICTTTVTEVLTDNRSAPDDKAKLHGEK